MLKSRREVLALKGFFFLFFFSFVGAVVGGLGTWSTGEGGVSVFVLLYGMVLDRGMAGFVQRNGGIVTYRTLFATGIWLPEV